MTAIHNPYPPTLARKSDGRGFHRLICVLAGGLALAGGILGVTAQPGFIALAAVAGLWLMIAPDSKGS